MKLRTNLANTKTIVSPPKLYFTSTNYYPALADTEATYHYLDEKAVPYCTEHHPTHGTNVQVTNGEIISPIPQSTIL